MASDTAKRTFRRFKRYTQKNCILICLYDRVSENCSVPLPELELTKLNLTNQICIDTAVRNSYLNASFITTCLEKCPIECNSVHYDVSSSSAAYPSESYKRFLDIYFNASMSFMPTYSRFVNMTKHEDKILSVNIFYKVAGFLKTNYILMLYF